MEVSYYNLPCKEFVEKPHQLLRRALIRERGETADIREKDAANKYKTIKQQHLEFMLQTKRPLPPFLAPLLSDKMEQKDGYTSRFRASECISCEIEPLSAAPQYPLSSPWRRGAAGQTAAVVPEKRGDTFFRLFSERGKFITRYALVAGFRAGFSAAPRCTGAFPERLSFELSRVGNECTFPLCWRRGARSHSFRSETNFCSTVARH